MEAREKTNIHKLERRQHIACHQLEQVSGRKMLGNGKNLEDIFYFLF